ncbi:acyl-CoA desaturase [Candidatus Parcubacteria bacterium]|nr:acyl-CoA desaturase [Candidatus Parcubacteria bacterium]
MNSSNKSIRDPSRVDPLQVPEGTIQVKWGSAIFIVALHLIVFVGGFLALFGLIPSFFSWPAFYMMIGLIPILGWGGIGMGYHRLFTHQSFTCRSWFSRLLCILGGCNLEGSMLWWVSTHRRHHQKVDTQPDPHTPLVNFLWAHVGWLLFFNSAIEGANVYQNTRDLQKDGFNVLMHKYNLWTFFWALHVVIIFFIGFLFGVSLGGEVDPYQNGISFVVWAVLVRTVIFWNVTWLVNSATHVWGYQNYPSDDESRNNWWVAIFTGGEGWHSNHHHDQVSASNQHRWWEVDLVYCAIKILAAVSVITSYKKSDRNKV